MIFFEDSGLGCHDGFVHIFAEGTSAERNNIEDIEVLQTVDFMTAPSIERLLGLPNEIFGKYSGEPITNPL